MAGYPTKLPVAQVIEGSGLETVLPVASRGRAIQDPRAVVVGAGWGTSKLGYFRGHGIKALAVQPRLDEGRLRHALVHHLEDQPRQRRPVQEWEDQIDLDFQHPGYRRLHAHPAGRSALTAQLVDSCREITFGQRLEEDFHDTV